MVTVYDCRWSLEDERPEIDFEDEAVRRNDWLTVANVLDGTLPIASFPSMVSVRVRHPQATEWDCYMDGGARGLFSQRFVDVVGKDALRHFSLLPCDLNGKPYFFLRCEQRVDCFNRMSAVFDTYPHDPATIMHIRHYAFFDDRVPEGSLFCIPEVPDLFATEDVVRHIKEGGLKGIRTPPLP